MAVAGRVVRARVDIDIVEKRDRRLAKTVRSLAELAWQALLRWAALQKRGFQFFRCVLAGRETPASVHGMGTQAAKGR
jgi:hypothetical protein